ncbi:hypothetical protein NDK47_05445 [Brevibacillus ruminantium]|uniref:Uncharacterized protein n=1 Tax=Brevibacillus ruminantium TaxID=2950604 RepID=A0ABY4WKS7_9BACL|nr:hypothetical protein [Brevibacillus ruminantium]USG66743.1 hypothetical protein NDK47_05445 [Brevibacillus ruminantium]
MRIWVISAASAVTICASAWAGYIVGSDVQLKQQRAEVNRLQSENESLRTRMEEQRQYAKRLTEEKSIGGIPTNGEQQQPSSVLDEPSGESIAHGEKSADLQHQAQEPLLADRDAIINTFQSMDDKGGSYLITEEEKREMMADPRSRDYKWVLRRFVKDRLNKQLESFQTTSRTVNPRTLLVTTTDNTAYEIEMKKWPGYNQIWTVERVNDLFVKTAPETGKRYEVVKYEEVPEKVQEWLKPLLASKDWKQEYLVDNETTYVLIKTHFSPTDSVEIEDVSVWIDEITVSYQTYDYAKSRDHSLVNPYILLEIPRTAAKHVTFHETLSIVY